MALGSRPQGARIPCLLRRLPSSRFSLLMPANIAFSARRYLLTLQRQSQRFSDEPFDDLVFAIVKSG
jgi:hypothetical protein